MLTGTDLFPFIFLDGSPFKTIFLLFNMNLSIVSLGESMNCLQMTFLQVLF